MSALAHGVAGSASVPRWERLDPLTRFGILASVLVLLCVSGGMLWLVGYNYDGLMGSAATKIHPSTYMIVLVFGWSVVSSGNPIRRTLHLIAVRPATVLMLAVTMFAIVVTVIRQGPGLGGMVDTYIASCLLVLLLADADDELMAALTAMLHVVMTVNALMALVEFATHHLFFPYRFDGIAFASDTRSAALQGHPLANAMLTACYLMALLSGARTLTPTTRTILIGLQSAALVVFGGRTALLASLMFGLGYGLFVLLGALRGRVSLIGAAAACAMAALVPLAVGALIAFGFFDDLMTRFVSDGGSAEAREKMFSLLNMFSLGDLIFGPDLHLVDTLRRVNGLEWGIENPVVRMLLYQGGIITVLVLGAFVLFMVELVRVTGPGLWLPMAVWFILLNGAETIAVKTTLPAKFAVVALCLYRRERKPAQTVTASPAPAPIRWRDRAAG